VMTASSEAVANVLPQEPGRAFEHRHAEIRFLGVRRPASADFCCVTYR